MNRQRALGTLVWVGSLALLGSALVLSPEFVEKHLSPDGHVNDQTRAVMALWRMVVGCVGVFIAALWFMRRPLVGYFSQYAIHRGQTPGERISARDLMGNPRLGGLGKILWIVLPLWLIVVDGSFLYRIQWPHFLLGEYGVFENGTAFLYLVAGLVALLVAFRRRGEGVPAGFQRWWMLLLGAFCIFVAGEEVNWGQIYFHFSTPEALKQVNQQKELSLHNLWIPANSLLPQGHWDHLMGQLLGLMGAAGPWLLCASKRLRRFVWTWEIPVPPLLAQGFFAAGALMPTDAIMFGHQMRPTEMREFSLAVAFAVWFYSERNRWRVYVDSTMSRAAARDEHTAQSDARIPAMGRSAADNTAIGEPSA